MQEEVETLLARAREARREHRPEDAQRDLIEAVRLARNGENRSLLAVALAALGQIERDLDRPVEALRHYGEAAALYRNLNDPLKLAHTVRHIGDIDVDLKQFELAEPFYTEALRIYRAHPDTPKLDLANALRGYALQREAVRDKLQAIAMWKEAGELYAACDIEAGVKESARRVAILNGVAK